MNNEIRIGGSYTHAVYGKCVVLRGNSRGYWISVWGGPCGDKQYTFKGVKAEELK